LDTDRRSPPPPQATAAMGRGGDGPTSPVPLLKARGPMGGFQHKVRGPTAVALPSRFSTAAPTLLI
jgi:hypothetical protein